MYMYKKCGEWRVYCVFSRQFDKQVTIWLNAPTACSTLRESCWGKRCTVSNGGARMCNKFTKGSSAAEEQSHAWGGKDCHTSNGATHNSIWIITAPTQAPRVPFHAFCISFSHFYTKLENASQGTMLLAHFRFALACCGWQSKDTDSWHGLLTTMLHKPRHSKFRRKLLPVTARTLFIKSCKSSWLQEQRKKKCARELN